MTTNQPEPLETRLNRLESMFADVGEVVLAQTDAINALTANVNALSTSINNLNQQTTANINTLAQQQANSLQRIEEMLERYLRPSGNGRGD